MGDPPRRRRCPAPLLLLAAAVLLLQQQPCASQDLLREMRVYNGAGYACLYAPVIWCNGTQVYRCRAPTWLPTIAR